MSILIKGIKMPMTCTMCDLAHPMKKSDGTAKLACAVKGKWQDVYNRRPSWCPLVEVDADETAKLTFADWEAQDAGELNMGDRIAIQLAKNGMSQRELAKKLNITEVSVSRYINNNRVPSATIIAKMSDVLHCTADELLGRSARDAF